VASSPENLLERVLASPQMTGADLARVVSTPEPYTIRPEGPARYRVVAVDLGIKASTPRHLAARGCEVLVVPATTATVAIPVKRPQKAPRASARGARMARPKTPRMEP